MSRAKAIEGVLPREAVFGRIKPNGLGPTPAEEFESWPLDESNPVELIGGWVMPAAPGEWDAGELWSELAVVLRPIVKARGWRMALDARHRLPSPPRTVVYPDVAIHAVPKVDYLPGTHSVGRVPDLVIELLSEETCERDVRPHGAKFLAYQMSGVREYYYCWPDGCDAGGFGLRRGVFVPLKRDREGFFHSPLLGHAIRLVEAAVRAL